MQYNINYTIYFKKNNIFFLFSEKTTNVQEILIIFKVSGIINKMGCQNDLQGELQMKKIIVLIVAIVLVAWLTPYAHEYFSNTSKEGEPVTITIPQGSAESDIALLLKEKGLIKNELVFKLKLRLSEYNGKLNYGTYTLSDGMCLSDIIGALAKPARMDEITFVVPEGFSAEQIAARASELSICSEAEFFEAMKDDYGYEFVRYIPKDGVKCFLQGFLFPETYSFVKTSTAHDIINTMLGEFEKRYTNEVGAVSSDIFEIVTKAALIEKEAKLESERPIISGVINNRIKESMPLQIDAAIVYAISDGLYNVDKVLYKDLEIDSPYNIYKNPGLPAGPICNPGLSAIKAAKNPVNHNYLYYHTDTEKNDGSHIFTETYQQHLNTMN